MENKRSNKSSTHPARRLESIGCNKQALSTPTSSIPCGHETEILVTRSKTVWKHNFPIGRSQTAVRSSTAVQLHVTVDRQVWFSAYGRAFPPQHFEGRAANVITTTSPHTANHPHNAELLYNARLLDASARLVTSRPSRARTAFGFRLRGVFQAHQTHRVLRNEKAIAPQSAGATARGGQVHEVHRLPSTAAAPLRSGA